MAVATAAPSTASRSPSPTLRAGEETGATRGRNNYIKGSEANLNFPGMLNEQIYSFAGLLEDADTAPNVQETQTYADLHARLGAQLAARAKLRDTELAAFRARSEKGGK